MAYFVSRQRYYYSGENLVEVTEGGVDYAGADMLHPKYPGEAKEYIDPREAVRAALAIRDLWRADGEAEVVVAVGCTLGMGIELEEGTDEYNLAWAEKQWESLEKCDRCGEPLGRDTYTLEDYGETFCSEYCADRAWEAKMEDLAEDEEEVN